MFLPPHSTAIGVFQEALTVLRSEQGVDPAHLVVSGVSRGAEAALLLGTTYPGMIIAVVAGSPRSVVNLGYPDTNRPAWTLSGEPIPAAPLSDWNEPSPANQAPVTTTGTVTGQRSSTSRCSSDGASGAEDGALDLVPFKIRRPCSPTGTMRDARTRPRAR